MDNIGPLRDFTPDGLIDDGWEIFKLKNPLNGRDYGRQAMANLAELLQAQPTLDYDGGPLRYADPARPPRCSIPLATGP
jgi:hypothetical protein